MGNVVIENVEDLFEYCPELGGSCLKWKTDRGSNKTKGKRAGLFSGRYWRVRVGGKLPLAHRIVWALIHKSWPTCDIDHIDGDRNNNRIENLRLCPNGYLDNLQNKCAYKNNTSGYPGVGWHKRHKKWNGRIGVGGKLKHLGYFDTPEEAYAAYLEAKADLHKFNPTVREKKSWE